MKRCPTRLPSPLLLVNKQLLNEMSLIPDKGELILDPPRLVDLAKAYAPVSQQKEMEVVMLPKQSVRRVVSIPRLPKFKAASSTIHIRDVCVEFSLSSAGRFNELWTNEAKMAVVRRADKRTWIFSQEALECVMNYVVEIQRRGVSLAQATDIVCNELVA